MLSRHLSYSSTRRAMEQKVTFSWIWILAELSIMTIPLFISNVAAMSPQGFVSIDCGGVGGRDPITGLDWTTDSKYLPLANQFAKEGVTIRANVTLGVNSLVDNAKQLKTALVFIPPAINSSRVPRSKFCFSLPVDFRATEETIAKNYLLRATFPTRQLTAVNHESGAVISFDSYSTRFYFTVDSTYVATVSLDARRPQSIELIISPLAAVVYVCLVPLEDRSSMPVISALELRPLGDKMYLREVQDTSVQDLISSRGIGVETSYLMTISRLNFGGDPKRRSLRYPHDVYDRLWSSPPIPRSQTSDVKSVRNTSSLDLTSVSNMYVTTEVSNNNYNFTATPEAVLSTAWVGTTVKSNISFTWDLSDDRRPQRQLSTFYWSLSFYDILVSEELSMNGVSRFVNILKDEGMGPKLLVQGQEIPKRWSQVYNKRWFFASETVTFTISSYATGYQQPFAPMINAAEIFGEFSAVTARTVKEDVTVVEKLAYNFSELLDGAGAGDPCLPVPWAWIVCSVELPPRVTQIHLTRIGVSRNLSGLLEGSNLVLTVLDLSFNKFGGGLPVSLGNISTLRELNLEGNQLSGEFPTWAPQSFGNMGTLSLSNNHISGDLASLVRALDGTISYLNVSHNRLSGPIPIEINNLTGLHKLDLSFNNLSGKLKVDVRRMDMLQILNLNNNSLTGMVPDNIFNNSNLEFVNLEGNRYTELNLTSWYGRLKEANSFGAISGNLQVRLRGNSIQRIIPAYLDTFDISLPSTEAERQQILLSLQKTFILLANNPWCNDREGSSKTSLVRYLCRENEQDVFWISSNDDRISTRTLIIVVITCGLLVIFTTCISAYFLWKMWRRARELQQIHEALAREHVKPPFFNHEDLKTGTRGFSTDNVLGKGGFGTVYKAELADGRILAVKKLNPTRQNTSDFLKEIVNVTGIKHRHLIQLLGCCVREKRQRMLVYEYAENRSLAEALWPRDSEKAFVLDWERRYNICLGIARGLAYLHEELQPKMVHRDIKPQNILLDKDYSPKIADFGLIRPSKTDDTQVTLTIGGTRGYIPPEYIIEGLVSEKLDVYSYGVVLLETVSGRFCIDMTAPEDQTYLPKWGMKLYKEDQLLELIDERLMGDYKEDEALLVLQTALACCQFQPKDRPTMSEVVNKLMRHSDVTVALAVDIVTHLREQVTIALKDSQLGTDLSE